MSEDQAELDDRPHSAATDPHATIAAGQPSTQWHPAKPVITEAEREHNAMMLGVTYRERVRGKNHNQCIILCVNPDSRRANKCPSCYGKVVPYDIYQSGFEPAPGRAQRFGWWVGEWVAALIQAARYPFQRDAEHYRALVIDTLQDAIQAGIRAEVRIICPSCGAKTEPPQAPVI